MSHRGCWRPPVLLFPVLGGLYWAPIGKRVDEAIMRGDDAAAAALLTAPRTVAVSRLENKRWSASSCSWFIGRADTRLDGSYYSGRSSSSAQRSGPIPPASTTATDPVLRRWPSHAARSFIGEEACRLPTPGRSRCCTGHSRTPHQAVRAGQPLELRRRVVGRARPSTGRGRSPCERRDDIQPLRATPWAHRWWLSLTRIQRTTVGKRSNRGRARGMAVRSPRSFKGERGLASRRRLTTRRSTLGDAIRVPAPALGERTASATCVVPAVVPVPPYTYGTGLGPVLDEGPDRLDHPARAAVRAHAPAVGKREELALGQQLDFHDPGRPRGW